MEGKERKRLLVFREIALRMFIVIGMEDYIESAKIFQRIVAHVLNNFLCLQGERNSNFAVQSVVCKQ